MGLRIHVLQHVPFEGPAAIADWAAYHGHSLSATHLFVPNSTLPAIEQIDVLVVMGGPMGVHDVAEYSWLQGELDFVRKVLESGKKVLGVCLGAQILAYVLGAAVTRNAEREIGWFPVTRTSNLSPKLCTLLPASFPAFHWHGETFALPAGAVALGSSAACAQQGFIWNTQALALQFHLETTPASAEALLVNGTSDLQGGGAFVQSPEQIRQGARENETALHRIMGQLLDAWLTLSGN